MVLDSRVPNSDSPVRCPSSVVYPYGRCLTLAVTDPLTLVTSFFFTPVVLKKKKTLLASEGRECGSFNRNTEKTFCLRVYLPRYNVQEHGVCGRFSCG
ncbi:unnamed protein product [Microthlaspi erraticum]|uniref:Uncharacterized protein n=1 Tax=Microthlaspi erraticum TaxID=1685480 RepID=A0A6D2IC73_9BRAS|nr:unnamed protein product [Microthlaspi erraticum]